METLKNFISKLFGPKNKGFNECEECHQEIWCAFCNVKHFQEGFKDWTSGNEDIDAAIRNSQLTAIIESNVLEWIPYDRFTDIEGIGEGGFGTIHKATWLDGRIVSWYTMRRQWRRVGAHFVALKTLKNSQNISIGLINELLALQKSCGGVEFTGIIRVYGVSKNPKTQEYILVLDYAKDGDLRRYIGDDIANFSWPQRINTLYQIIIGLKQLHSKGLIHKDLHGGNVVCGSGYVLVTDLGLCQPADMPTITSSNRVYGVMPYMAPEVLSGQPYTKASDVYSFGMVMYDVATGQAPFADVPHNAELAHKICNGLRPQLPNSIPPFYKQLMQQCWDSDPSTRPSAENIAQIVHRWQNEPTQEIKSELQEAETMRIKISKETTAQTIHPEAFLTSRLMPTINPTVSYSEYVVS